MKEAIGLAIGYTITYLCVGLPLDAVKSDLLAYTEDCKQYACPYTIQQLMLILHQTILNLQGSVDNPSILQGCVMDQGEELQKVEGLGQKMTLRDINSNRLMLSSVFGDWNTAEALIQALEEYMDAKDGFFMRDHFRRCYLGLAGFALGRKVKSSKYRKKYNDVGKKMLKFFTTEMRYGSVNAYPIVTMLEAEESPSKEKYDKAIKACARLGLVHHEAYMCERAAEFFIEKGDHDWSMFYIAEAILLYGEWGAQGKVDQLTKDYSHILSKIMSLRESVNSSLQGRSRYSSRDLDSLRTIDWDTFSTS